MAKHIHVHVHTSDNFSESDHPRAKNGQFGSGGGGGGGASAKTGSAAPAKSVNVGSAKYPLMAKSTAKLPGKGDQHGFTHHVPGFKAPELRDHKYDGDNIVQHDGGTYTYSGQSGKHIKSGKQEYSFHGPEGSGKRIWVAEHGHARED